MASGEAGKSPAVADAKSNPSVATRLTGASLPPARRFIRLDRIIVADRLRPVDLAAVDMLAVSIGEGELNTPITVRPLRVDGDDMVYGLVTGAHRYAALEKLGRVEIDCTIRDLTDDQARMVEIDENLIRRGLTPLERAVFLDQRLMLWMRLHPERSTGNGAKIAQFTEVAPRRGRPAKSEKLSQFLGEAPPTMGFAEEAGDDLGISRRTVYNALTIARGLSPDTRAKVSGTKIARNEGLLRQLAGVADKGEQLRVAEVLASEKAKSFPDALVIAAGREPTPPAPPRPVDETVAAFMTIWKKAPPTHQDAILHALSGQRLPKGWTVTKGAADA